MITCARIVFCLFLSIVVSDSYCFGQLDWVVKVGPTNSSLRGLHAIDRDTAWACGSEGTILRYRDATLPNSVCERFTIAGMEKSEFRSIHAWDGMSCIVATAGQPAAIFKTIDGGATWKTVYTSDNKASFYNGMKFWNASQGVVFGDPISSELEILITADAGESWKRLSPDNSPQVTQGEAGFAASNSSMLLHKDDLWVGLGGREGDARLVVCQDFRERAFANKSLRWSATELNQIQSSPTRGVFSLAAMGTSMVAVGGDYKEMDNQRGTIAFREQDLSWKVPAEQSVGGFRSCVVFAERHKRWIATGPTGSDMAESLHRWNPLSTVGFHVLHVAKDGSVWAAGSGGRVGRLVEQ